MNREKFDALKRELERIFLDSETIKHLDRLRAHKDEIIEIVSRVVKEHSQELMKTLPENQSEEILNLVRDFLHSLIERNGDHESIRKFALLFLKHNVSLYEVAAFISKVMEHVKPMLVEKIPDIDKSIDRLKQHIILVVALLSEEMTQDMLETIGKATGMSQNLLMNFMRAVIDEEIESTKSQ